MNKENNAPQQLLTVGLGASAGGLEALKAFFSSLPEQTGMAFIVIVHLAPDYESNMAELLQRETSLEVLQVSKKVELEAEHVYVIPPQKLLTVGDNHLELSEPEQEHSFPSVDLFFRSLARAKGERSACIIFSGTGNDGTTGIKSVKEAGGLTIVQDPDEAQYPGMPQSAIEMNFIDFVLPAAQMVEELMKYKKGLSNIHISNNGEEDEKALQQIFEQIRSETNHDFSNYKRSSVLRRMERRMQVNLVNDLTDYAAFLKKNPGEINELFKDLLISVTNFFRDKEAFEELEETIIPKLFEEKEPDEQLRVWVPGCATGEEAYSIAMLLKEYVQQVQAPPEIQIFASDIDESALTVGREGRFPQSISAYVSAERLNKHFIKEGPEYLIKRQIRDMVLFARHDLLRDPPFSNQDLISCRNLLIYLNGELQSDVFNLFHYTLRSKGYLFLGLSGSNLEATELFTPVHKKLRIYQRRPTATSNLRLPQAPLRFAKKGTALSPTSGKPSRNKSNFESLHKNLLTQRYAPESVIINENYEVLHATDNIQKYLEYRGGEPSHVIVDMVKPILRQPLQSMLFKAKKKKANRLKKQCRLVYNEQAHLVDIIVHTIHDSDFSEKLFQIIFEEIKPSASNYESKISDKGDLAEEKIEVVDVLEEELKYTKEQLQIAIEEYETSNEELRAANEELQSMNEELQSTTEELETSQEELRSVNEELKTANQELENKIEKLAQANSDLKNLMDATEVGILFVDRNLCLQRFTDSSKELFNLILSDKGRPISHITHHLEYESLLDDIKRVNETHKKVRKVVRSNDGDWYMMRIRSYRSSEGKIEGVVLSFVKFIELKEARQTIQEQSYQQTLVTLGVYALEQKDLQSILKRAIDLGCISLELDCSVIYALNKEQDTFEITAQAGCAKEGDSVTLNNKWDAGFALDNDEPTIVTDYKKEQRFALSPFLEDEAVVSSVHIAVRGTGSTFGLLGFYSHEQRTFLDHEVDFLQVVANIVGMAIERHRDKEKLKKEVEKSKQYQREILDNNLSERWRVGQYLHDNLGQLLASLKILINDFTYELSDSDDEKSKDITLIKQMLDQGMKDIRDLTNDIIPVDIEEEGVTHALRFMMKQISDLYEVTCHLETDDILNKIKDRKVGTHLYHVIQEASKNAAVHGQAERITISIDHSDENLLLRIADDGKGVSSAQKNREGKGLRIMQHRMEMLDGTFRIENTRETDRSGTVVTATVPLDRLDLSTNE